MPLLDLNSDEWHVDETVIKIAGVKYYMWFVVDAETRFVIAFHLSPHRDSPQAFATLQQASKHGKPTSLVSDRYNAYKASAKSVFPESKHIRVRSFSDTTNSKPGIRLNKVLHHLTVPIT